MTSPALVKNGPVLPFWRNTTATEASAILNDDRFTNSDGIGLYRWLAEVAGRDFPNIRAALDQMPLFQSGAAHKTARARFALVLHQAARPIRAAITAEVAGAVGLLSTPGEIEVIEDLVTPMTRKVMASITGIDAATDLISIVDANPTLAKLRRAEADLQAIRARIEAIRPEAGTDEIDLFLGMSLNGFQPLSASLGVSLMQVLHGATNRRLCDLDWPDDLPATAVVDVFRMTRSGQPLAALPGMPPITHAMLDMTVYLSGAPDANPAGIFSTGAHACMGRGLSQMLWLTLARSLRQTETRVTWLDAGPVSGKFVAKPTTLRIRISNDR